MREVYSRPASDTGSPACLRTRTPRAAAPRAAPGPPPLRPLPPNIQRLNGAKGVKVAPRAEPEDCEEAEDVAALDDCDIGTCRVEHRVVSSARPSVRGHEELPYADDEQIPAASSPIPCVGSDSDVGGSPNCGARAYVTLPRRRSGVAAALFRNAALPPRRTTPDGTDIYYWCDVPKRKHNELDGGAYNPLWAMRGFSQTYHLWKEGRRAMSAPLNAYLTYVTLPWWSIAKDILDHREEPILTF